MKHLSVLIVGAGPTGLMMACELARQGISFRIIDQKAEPEKGSNATWIQPRTLEIFDSMGIVEQFLRLGHTCEAINFYENGRHLANLPLNIADSLYPFILMLPQKETEYLLNNYLKKLNIHVERSIKLVDTRQTNSGILSIVETDKHQIENIKSDWLIGCDGIHSTVREKCQITFTGKDLPEQFVVADAEMESFLPSDEIHVFFDKGIIFPEKSTIFTAFPYGEKNYRLLANIYNQLPRQTIHEHEVKEIVISRAHDNFVVNNISWISPFWIHGNLAKNMQKNSIFILGDAAHIHSPAGGQGMNTGIQDAYNLAWKLSLIIKKQAKSSLIDSFQLERYPIIKKIVSKTNSLTNMVLFDKDFSSKLHHFRKSLIKTGKIKKIVNQLTQVDIFYKNSPIINYAEKPPKFSPKQGERAPDVELDASRNLYRYFTNNKHTILVFTGLNEKEISKTVIETYQKIIKYFSNMINTLIISQISLEMDNLILDENSNIHKKYHILIPSLYVIRPDTYISYFSENFNFNELDNHLRKYLIFNN